MMTSRRIVYRRPDGSVSVVVPAPAYVAALMAGRMTEDEAIAAIRAKDVPGDASDVAEVDDTDIPVDRTFRDAWRRGSATPVVVDMPSARQIHRSRLERRLERTTSRLRTAYLEAQEDGETTRAAVIRQRLRDLRTRVRNMDLDGARTPDELKMIDDGDLDRDEQ